jgi:hypothetical protein
MVRPRAASLRSLAAGALIIVATLASPGRAVAHVGPDETECCRQTDSALTRTPGPYGRPFIAALLAVPLVTHVRL